MLDRGDRYPDEHNPRREVAAIPRQPRRSRIIFVMVLLNRFAADVYSQNGEDGIIEHILASIDGGLNKWCVQFRRLGWVALEQLRQPDPE